MIAHMGFHARLGERNVGCTPPQEPPDMGGLGFRV